MSNPYFLIGAGLFNCTLAYLLAKNNKKVVIFESRDHVGGNCYDEIDSITGIRYHRYGPHIIHLQNEKWITFLKKFTKLIPFHHSVKSLYQNKLYQIPINLDTINSFYGVNIKPYEVLKFLKTKITRFDSPQNMEEKLLSLIGEELYEAFFKTYTIKQWGKDPKTLPSSTIQRIPFRNNFNSSYYSKKYSFIPEKGFTNLILNLLDNKKIELNLNSLIELKQINNLIKKGIVIFSGEVDKLFEYKYGKLEYRSLYFKKEYKNTSDYQGISVINFPEIKYKWTRICEPIHFPHIENKIDIHKRTLLIKEFSCAKTDDLDAYYPIADVKNMDIYNIYKNESIKIPGLFLAGRLGMYKYTDIENTLENSFRMYQNVQNK